MRFDEENKVIIDSMDVKEAIAFIKFLNSEILRHQTDIQNADDLILIVKNKFGIEDVE